MANISITGSHNAAIAIEKDDRIITVIEVERILNYKNAGIAQYKPAHTKAFLIPFVLNFIKEQFDIHEFENCFYLETEAGDNGCKINYHEVIPAGNYIPGSHHLSHAAGSFYQSPFQAALVFSFDGGGNDGYFNVYHATRQGGVELIGKHDVDLGFPYMSFGIFLNDIKYEPSLYNANLVYPGKLMGLCAFGNVLDEFLPIFKAYYYSSPSFSPNEYLRELNKMGAAMGIQLEAGKRLEGQMAFDIAATSQRAFEDCFLEIIHPYLVRYPDLPLCITGGCALNIILNTRVKMELMKEVFVAPNPSDCGLAMGMLADYMRPDKPIDITYSGIPVVDKHTLLSYVENNHGEPLDIDRVVADLFEGSIVGLVRNNAEHGPRALGNRSILCNPVIPGMRDVLNKKVKNREWYRPFAPVCRLEDVGKYFEFSGESRFMTFCPKVRNEWLAKLQSIVHVDNSARIQTVTREQNPWLYDLLTRFERISDIGVLLNTSFNVDGKPIVSTYRDAVEVFEKTEMDRLILDDYYIFSKKGIY